MDGFSTDPGAYLPPRGPIREGGEAGRGGGEPPPGLQQQHYQHGSPALHASASPGGREEGPARWQRLLQSAGDPRATQALGGGGTVLQLQQHVGLGPLSAAVPAAAAAAPRHGKPPRAPLPNAVRLRCEASDCRALLEVCVCGGGKGGRGCGPATGCIGTCV